MPDERLSAVAAVYRDLEAIGKVDPALAESSLAATAVAMAFELDSDANSATSKSNCARVLIDAIGQLRATVPEGVEHSDLDDLRSRAASLLAG